MAIVSDALTDVLREVRSRSGLSYAALGEKLGISRVTAFNREQGKHDMPATQLLDLARATGSTIVVSPDGWAVSEPAQPGIPANPERDQALSRVEDRRFQLPLLGVASAGPGTWNDERPTRTISVANRWLTKLDGVIEVHGDSMEPMLENGDLVGARLGEGYAIGDVVIAVAEWGECLIKVYSGYLEEEGLLILTSLNPSYAPIVGRPDMLSIQGVAYGLLRAERLWVG